MKRIAVALVLGVALLAGAHNARAQSQPTFAQVVSGCTSTPQYGTMQWCFDKGTGTLYFWNGSAFAAYPVAVSELTISQGISPHTAGYQALRIASPVAMCTTSNTIGSTCAEPTQTYSPGFADTNYTISCTCASVGTNVPVVQSVTKASNTLVVTVAALTAASASCAEIDCLASHD